MSSDETLFRNLCRYSDFENVPSRKNRNPPMKKKKGFASCASEPDMMSMIVPNVGMAGPTDGDPAAQSAFHASLVPWKLLWMSKTKTTNGKRRKCITCESVSAVFILSSMVAYSSVSNFVAISRPSLQHSAFVVSLRA